MKREVELSNISYTNKDFFDIYPELLSLAKKLSVKWDPTVSNESDPGVVLIKELALIGDKINYIADKYALENNPRSVTQLDNARQLYNLLGYYPRWFQSAKINVSMYWNGDIERGKYLHIPKFTAIQDPDGEFVYTTLQEILLPLDGTFATGEMEAIEGTYNRLVVNNSDVITLSMFSDDQRIYINNYNVAENGLFVSDLSGKTVWTKVDNVNLLSEHTTSYSFNVDIVTGECYLQFPRDLPYLIGDGLQIGYIVSKGSYGNIPIGHLDRLQKSEITVDDSEGESRKIDTTNISVTNSGAIWLGKDPETIDEMYSNWKKVASTFNTLVTLRDYNNCIRRYPDLASNAFVTDRTNDVQLSYKIMVGTQDKPNTKTKIEKDDYNQEKLNAFDLKLYALKSFPYSDISDYKNYDETFSIFSDVDFDVTDSNTQKLLDAFSTYQCISHDFAKLEPNKICLLKNKYNVNVQIISNQELTEEQTKEIKENICKAVYNNFNSSKVEFGEKIDYDELVSCIKDSDNRIKTAIVDRLVYDTYAVFYDESAGVTWFEVPVSNEAYIDFYNNTDDYYKGWMQAIAKQRAKEFRTEIIAKNILAGVTPLLIDVGGEVPYALDNAYTLDVEAAKIKTDVNIPISFSDSNSPIEIKVGPNEVIQISKPNLIDIRSYGAYIYYEYIGSEVPANENYTLKSGETLCLFYKEADADAQYRFDLYSEGTIICPSFILKQNDRNGITSKIFGDRVPASGEYITQFKAVESTRTYDGLSVKQSITIKKVNKITLPNVIGSEAYIYFITKDKVDNQYLLKFRDGRKILLEDEYFIYTNSSRTSLEILGRGTEIKWVGTISPQVLYCDVVSISDIASYGSFALKNKWLPIKDPIQLEIIEKTFVNAMEGDTVSISLRSGESDSKLVLNSEGLSGQEYFDHRFNSDQLVSIDDQTDTELSFEHKTGSTLAKDFVKYMHGELFTENIYEEYVDLKCVAVRTSSDEPPKLYYWRATKKDGTYQYILDIDSYNTLFTVDGHLFASELQYFQTLGIAQDDPMQPADTDDLVTIDDTNQPSGDNTQQNTQEQQEEISYRPTEAEIEAATSWYTLWVATNRDAKYLQNFVVYDSTNLNYDVTAVDGSTFSCIYSYTLPGQIVLLSNFSVRINNGEEISNNKGELAAEIRAYLNINMGPKNPQQLRYDPNTGIYDSMIFYDENGRVVGYINVDDQNLSDQYVYCEDDIFAEGSEAPIDVQLYDDSLNKYKPKFYAYKVMQANKINDDPTLVEASGNTYYLQFGPYTTSQKALDDDNPRSTIEEDPEVEGAYKIVSDIALPDGSYIFSVTHTNKSFDELFLYYNSQSLTIFGTDGLTNLSEPKTHYVLLESAGNQNSYFSIKYSLKYPNFYTENQLLDIDYVRGDIFQVSEDIYDINDEGEQVLYVKANEFLVCKRDKTDQFRLHDFARSASLDSIILSSLVKYEYNEILSSDTNRQEVIIKIQELDYDNEFNYMYTPPERQLIKDPLTGESFLNVNHFYNQFTICEAKKPEILV